MSMDYVVKFIVELYCLTDTFTALVVSSHRSWLDKLVKAAIAPDSSTVDQTLQMSGSY